MWANMGNELKRDRCPQKYTAKSSIIGDIAPTIIAVVVVAMFSGSLFSAAGINNIVNLAFEIGFICIFSFVIYFMFGKVKKNMAQTYISVCENGICGIRALNGIKNAPFSLLYSEILDVSAKGERLILSAKQGKIVFTLEDCANTAFLIKQKAGL